MLIRKAFKFRLKTNSKIEQKFFQFSGSCRYVFNHFLAQRKEMFEEQKKSLSYVEQANQLPQLKKELEWLKDSPSQILQQSLKDLDQSYKNFFRRVKQGEKPGFPKFKKKGFSDSFRYPQGFKFEENKVFLPKVGWVRFFKSQEIEGTPKNLTVSRKGKYWYISVQVEVEKEEKIHPSDSVVGIDMGITNFATLSDGTIYEPLNSFRKLELKLAKEQRKLAKKKKFSNNWKKQKNRINQIHMKIADSRKDYLHKTSTEISKNHAIVVLEDLKVSKMSKSAKGNKENPGKNVKTKSKMNKSILDQGWFEFRKMLEYKEKWNGGFVVLVNPKNTSRTCPKCGLISKENRKTQQNFKCIQCGFNENADINASKNILAVGQSVLACGDGTLVPSVKQESYAL